MTYFLWYLATIPVAFLAILLFFRRAIPGPRFGIWVACSWPAWLVATVCAFLILWLGPWWEKFDNWWTK